MKYQISSKDEYEKISMICDEFKNVGVSFSAFKESIKVLVTLRVGGHLGYIIAEKIKDKLINKFKENNIYSNDEIQKEYSIYDTNVNYDNGWLSTIHEFN